MIFPKVQFLKTEFKLSNKFLLYIIQSVPKVSPFLGGTSFRDAVECWKIVYYILRERNA
jgi:hypothetical protein